MTDRGQIYIDEALDHFIAEAEANIARIRKIRANCQSPNAHAQIDKYLAKAERKLQNLKDMKEGD